MSCGFTSHLTQNRSYWTCSPSQSFGWYGKTKPNTTKAHIHQSKNVVQHKMNTKKLKPGLVAFCDIRPGNGEGLFWFQHFINLSRHIPTYLQPQDLHRAAEGDTMKMQPLAVTNMPNISQAPVVTHLRRCRIFNDNSIIVSDIAIFVLKRDVKLQPTNR